MATVKPVNVADLPVRWPAERREVAVAGSAADEQGAYRELVTALGAAAAAMRPDDLILEIDRAPDGSCRFKFRAYRK